MRFKRKQKEDKTNTKHKTPKTFDIIIITNRNKQTETKTVTARLVKGEFGVYDTRKIDIRFARDERWAITHIPTGNKVQVYRTLAEVNSILEKIKHIHIENLKDEAGIAELGKLIF